MGGRWVTVAAINGLLAVALGAFGAHVLKGRLEPAQLSSFEVGVRYQMYHALALLAVAWVISNRPSRAARAAAIFMLIGVILFSGSIYGLTLASWRWLGPVTPIGGVCLMIAWVLLAWAGGGTMRGGPVERSP